MRKAVKWRELSKAARYAFLRIVRGLCTPSSLYRGAPKGLKEGVGELLKLRLIAYHRLKSDSPWFRSTIVYYPTQKGVDLTCRIPTVGREVIPWPCLQFSWLHKLRKAVTKAVLAKRAARKIRFSNYRYITFDPSSRGPEHDYRIYKGEGELYAYVICESLESNLYEYMSLLERYERDEYVPSLIFMVYNKPCLECLIQRVAFRMYFVNRSLRTKLREYTFQATTVRYFPIVWKFRLLK